jgi:hypothetical protein
VATQLDQGGRATTPPPLFFIEVDHTFALFQNKYVLILVSLKT